MRMGSTFGEPTSPIRVPFSDTHDEDGPTRSDRKAQCVGGIPLDRRAILDSGTERILLAQPASLGPQAVADDREQIVGGSTGSVR